MRFRQLLVAGIGAQVALIAIVCGIAIVGLTDVTRDARRETRHAVDDLLSVHQIRVHASSLGNSARGYLITSDRQYIERLDAARRELTRELSELDSDAVDAAARAEATRQLDAYSQAIDLAITERKRITSLAALEEIYERRLAPRRQLLDLALEKLERANSERVDRTAARAQRVASTARMVLLAASAVAILLAIGLGVLVARRLARQFAAVQVAKREASEAADARREILDIVSHDLRSPLNTISLGLDVLREEHGELAHLKRIENATQRMQRLVGDLLDAARAQTSGLQLELSQIDSYELLVLTIESFAERAERAGIELRIAHPTHAEIVADRDRILQILANLVGNALQVTPRGGSIVLAATPTAGGIRFSVHDSGPGIDQRQVPQLFEAYKSSGSSVRGNLGLGLYISKTLAQAHGGKIGVDTKPAEGSTFWFELPGTTAVRPTGVSDRSQQARR